MTTRWIVAAAMLASTARAGAQDLRTRIESAPDGIVRLSYASKEGVCGNGRGNISTHRHGKYRDDGWESECEEGPVRVAIDISAKRVYSIRTYVGGRWRPIDGRVTDLGMVGAPQAAAYFLGLAERGDRVKGDAILPAILADSAEVWRDLLRIAKNDRLGDEPRKSAVFWLSQEASDAATKGLTDLVEDDNEDREVREQAVFALSQLPDDQGVPALIKAAKTSKDPSVRKKAIFWLGQSDDPRALTLFEEILATKP
jgi:hypothetical protein